MVENLPDNRCNEDNSRVVLRTYPTYYKFPMNSFGVRKGVTTEGMFASLSSLLRKPPATGIVVVEALLRDASFANSLCGEFVPTYDYA